MSALIGFICSFLLFLAPIGVILGIIGIIVTRGGRRRGRGLAIAAIPIGVLMSLFVVVLTVSAFAVWESMKTATAATKILKTSTVHVHETADEFYTAQDERFRLAVAQPQFEAWVAGVIKKHGSLQNVKLATESPPKANPQTGEWSFNFVGEFVNGTALVTVVMAPLGVDEPQVRNLIVDGVPAIPESSSEEDDAS